MASLEVPIDPRAEWTQIFNEAWRINRDYFYAPNMHGANWTAMREKYAAFLPDVVAPLGSQSRHPVDVQRARGRASSRRRRRHSRHADDRPGGLLGADYAIENGRYRFKKVYGGLNWNPDLRAPLTEPGVNAKAGEYLLAVDGKRTARADERLQPVREHVGKLVEITFGPNADGTGSADGAGRADRERGGAAQSRLGRRQPAEGRRGDWRARRVCLRAEHGGAGSRISSATSFRRRTARRSSSTSASTAAVRSRTTTSTSCGGRSSAIGRRVTAQDLQDAGGAIHGPKVMIIDETAGSGGDLLPWMFRRRSSDRSSASAPGAASSASSASRC